MPQKVRTVTPNTSGGAFVQLDPNVNGSVSCAFYGEQNMHVNFVTGVTTAADALTEFNAGRFAKLPTGWSALPGIRWTFDPSKTWVRSPDGTTAGAFNLHMEW